MIKKWNSFINESKSDYISEILKILEDKEFDEENGDITDLPVFLKLIDQKFVDRILGPMLLYVNTRYNEKSKNIKKWGGLLFSNWMNGKSTDQRITSTRAILYDYIGYNRRETIKEMLNHYDTIKDEVEVEGNTTSIMNSELQNEFEMMAETSFNVMKFDTMRESYEGIQIRLMLVVEDRNFNFLDKISNEVVPFCERIQSFHDLKNTDMSIATYDDHILILLDFI